jgi:hypothetical protein
MLARASRTCKRQITPLVREGVPPQQIHKCLTVKIILSLSPDGCSTPRYIAVINNFDSELQLLKFRYSVLIKWCCYKLVTETWDTRGTISRWKPLQSNDFEDMLWTLVLVCVVMKCKV